MTLPDYLRDEASKAAAQFAHYKEYGVYTNEDVFALRYDSFMHAAELLEKHDLQRPVLRQSDRTNWPYRAQQWPYTDGRGTE